MPDGFYWQDKLGRQNEDNQARADRIEAEIAALTAKAKSNIFHANADEDAAGAGAGFDSSKNVTDIKYHTEMNTGYIPGFSQPRSMASSKANSVSLSGGAGTLALGSPSASVSGGSRSGSVIGRGGSKQGR